VLLQDTCGRRNRIRTVELVFTNRGGLPWRRQRFADAWRATVARAGLPATTRAHDLRHTFAATLISGGASPKVVLLGHKTTAETLDTYGNLRDGDLERARDAVQLALATPAQPDGPERAAGMR
jgi:site-specific recombinase XerD